MSEIHPSAIVDPRAKIGENVSIGPFVTVGPEVELAAGVELRPHSHVVGRTLVGEGTRIFPFASIGEEPQDKSFSGEETELVIGRGNVIRENAVIHVGTRKGGGRTRIGDDNLIMNGVHIGHDSVIGSHCIIASQCALGGHVTVEDYATVGGLTGIHQFARVGESAMVAALSGLTKDAPPFSLVAGERATLRGLNVVGIKRRDMPARSRSQLRRAYHILFGSKQRLEPALEQVRAEGLDSDEVGRLIAFLSSSDRGFCR